MARRDYNSTKGKSDRAASTLSEVKMSVELIKTGYKTSLVAGYSELAGGELITASNTDGISSSTTLFSIVITLAVDSSFYSSTSFSVSFSFTTSTTFSF